MYNEIGAQQQLKTQWRINIWSFMQWIHKVLVLKVLGIKIATYTKVYKKY